MHRRIFIAALAFMLAVPLLGGCSLLPGTSDDDTGAGVTTQQTDQGQETDDGMDRVTVPAVTDMDAERAIAALESAGLKPQIEWVNDEADHRTVVYQSARGGEIVAPDSRITLRVSLGPVPESPTAPMITAALKAIEEAEEAAAAAAAAEAAAAAAVAAAAAADTGGGSTTTVIDADDIPGVPFTSSPIDGEVDVGDPDNVYSINMIAGQSLLLSIHADASAVDPDFEIYIYSPTATSIDDATAVKSATEGGHPRTISYDATTTGKFYVQVHHGSTTPGTGGTYSLIWTLGSGL